MLIPSYYFYGGKGYFHARYSGVTITILSCFAIILDS